MKRTFLTPPRAVRGVSLIELMTAMTIGLLILLGLTTVFVNSSNSSRELKNTAEQIENGRYAIELLTQDIRHAGYFGELSVLPTAPSAAPDACVVPTPGVVSDAVNAALALPLQYISAAAVPTACAAYLTAANLQANSDIVVVRRADTTRMPISCTTSVTLKTTPTTADPFMAAIYYLQTAPNNAEIQMGGANGTVINSTKNATGGAYTPITMARRDQSVTAGTTAGTCAAAVAGQFPEIAASIRKYRTHVYFVAPCSIPANGTSICTGSGDDQGRPDRKSVV